MVKGINIDKPQRDVLARAFGNDQRTIKAVELLFDSFQKVITDEVTTDEVAEGTENLYFTDERVDDRVANLIIGGDNIDTSYDDTANTLTIDGIPFDPTQSGVISGLAVTFSGTVVNVSAGKARFSSYDGTKSRVIDYPEQTVVLGDVTKDLNNVYAGWGAMSPSAVVFFLTVGEDGVIYQSDKATLVGEVVRKYLAIAAVQIDNAIDRNVTTVYPFQNVNAQQYELSNVMTPQFVSATDLELMGNVGATTFKRSAGSIYFSGNNIGNPLNRNISTFDAVPLVPFLVSFQLSGGGFYLSPTVMTNFAPYIGTYDDGLATGTLPTGVVTNNKYAVHYLFFETTIGLDVIVISQYHYNTLIEAQDAVNLNSIRINIPPFLRGVKNRGYMITKGDASDFSDTAQMYIKDLDTRFFKRIN